MALFDPPLYKHGNKKCPNCGEPVPWTRVWVWGRGQWNCRSCRSILATDAVRLIPGMLLLVPLLVVLTTVDPWGRPLWATILFWTGAVAVAVFAQWWFGSIVLRRPAKAETTSPLKT